MRFLATAATTVMLVLTGCSSNNTDESSEAPLTHASHVASPASGSAVSASRGTFGSEQIAPIAVTAANDTGQDPTVSIEVTCDTTKPGLIFLQSAVDPNHVVKYVVSNPKSEIAVSPAQVQQIFGPEAQIVNKFSTQLSNTLLQENVLAVTIGTEMMEPGDHCHISATGPRGMLVNEDVTSVPGETIKMFTFKLPPAASAAEPSVALDPAPAAQAPRTTFTSGTHLVGTDIAPGTYRAAGGAGCYYERLSDLSGEFSAIISNGRGVGPIITISESDVAFQSRNCGQWQHVE